MTTAYFPAAPSLFRRFRVPLAACLLAVVSPTFARPSVVRASNLFQQQNKEPIANVGSKFVSLRLDVDGDSSSVHIVLDSNLESKISLPILASSVFHCPAAEFDVQRDKKQKVSSFDEECETTDEHAFLIRSGSIDLRPIKRLQSANPDVDFTVSVLLPSEKHVRCSPPGADVSSESNSCTYSLESPVQLPDSVRYEFGYERAQIIRILAVLGFLLLIPIALTFWFRNRVSTATPEMAPTVLFAYRRFLTWTFFLGILLWWTALDILHVLEFAAFLLPATWKNIPGVTEILPWFLVWSSPALVYFSCLLLSAPMVNLRGTQLSRGEIFSRSFWSVARFMIPWPMLYFGVTQAPAFPRLGIMLILAGLLSSRFINARFMRSQGMELHALTTGELRDRAFALAEKAHTKLNHLYVFPMASLRIANAFAHRAQNVFLTDYLVDNLNKSEVDAVIAHEITHLQKKHLTGRLAFVMVFLLIATLLGIFVEPRLPVSVPNGPIIYGLFLLAVFFLARGNEFAADAGAAKLTGSAEAMMSALARITRLNIMPLQWSKLDEKLLTHPSTLRRIQRLARDAGISEARTSEILAQSFAPPTDTYSIPATALKAGKIFSTRFKTQLRWKMTWTMLLTAAVVPAAVALFVRRAGLEGGALFAAYAAGFVLTVAASLAIVNFVPLSGLPKLERQFRAKFQTQHPGSPGTDSLFVGLAPDSQPRIYEGNWTWDLGFLSLDSDRLSYCGEETKFALQRDQISNIALGLGPAGWIRVPSIYISWRDSAGNRGVFNLRPMNARSMRQMGLESSALFRDLQNWLDQKPPTASPVLSISGQASENPGLPLFGQVTGIDSRAALRMRPLFRDFVRTSIVALAVGILFGLYSSSGFGAFYVSSSPGPPAPL